MTSDDLSGLGEFRARLRAASGKSGQGMTIQGFAVAIGALGIAGFAPVLSRRMPRPARREAAAGGGLPLSPSPAREVVPTETGKRVPGLLVPQKGFREVLAAARQEAAQASARRASERVAAYLPPGSGDAPCRAFAPVLRYEQVGAPGMPRGGEAMGAAVFALPASRVPKAMPGWRGRGAVPLAAANMAGRGAGPDAAASEPPAPVMARPAAGVAGEDLAQALRAYFFRQSRLPPAGGTGFDPRLTPAWAGVKIPG
ncbi:MAG TPA: hypothetical protein VLT37_00005 [Acidocella sp.]|nr:hypothetical protein [Acidocella sp.]